MRMTVVAGAAAACAALICLDCDAATAGLMRGNPARLSVVTRPPGSIPRPGRQAYRGGYPPLPRARPSSAPASQAATATAASTRSPQRPPVPRTTTDFPPVVTLE